MEWFRSRDKQFYKYHKRSLENPQRNQVVPSKRVLRSLLLQMILFFFQFSVPWFHRNGWSSGFYFLGSNHNRKLILETHLRFPTNSSQNHLIAFSFSGQHQINMISIQNASLDFTIHTWNQRRNNRVCIRRRRVQTHLQLYNNHAFVLYIPMWQESCDFSGYSLCNVVLFVYLPTYCFSIEIVWIMGLCLQESKHLNYFSNFTKTKIQPLL